MNLENFTNKNYLKSIPILYSLFPYFNIILSIWIFSLIYTVIFNLEINDYLFILSILSFFIISLKIESKIANFSIIGPFTFVIIFQVIIPIIGIYLLILGNKLLEVDFLFFGVDFLKQLDSIKYAFFLGTPFRLIGFWLVFRFFKPNQFNFLNKIKKVQSSSILKIGCLLLLFSLLKTLIFFFTGSADRSILDVDSINSATSSISGIFVVFTGLSEISYLLAPLIIKISKAKLKIIIYITLFIIFLFTTLVGSRSPIINMLLFFLMGSLIFKTFDPKSIKRVLIIFLVSVFFFIPIIDRYRNLSSFASDATVSGRISTLFSNKLTREKPERGKNLTITGAALYGTVTDLFVYKDTPRKIDHAGFKNFNSIFYLFLPKSFFPNSPSTFDGQEISQEYVPFELTSFASISFNADLYRRFSWIGVSIGNLIWGLSYGLISLILFKRFYKNPTSFSLLSILILYAFYSQPQTVLNQFWLWLYNFPKYLIIFYFLCICFNTTRKLFHDDKVEFPNKK